MEKKTPFADALFPRGVVCALCGNEAIVGADGLCDACRAALTRVPPSLPVPDGLDGLVAGLVYNDVTEAAIHRFKYKRQVYLAPYLAGFITLPPEWAIDCMVPVPLHPLRKWLRTFNQSDLLAESLSLRYPIPIRKDLLVRIRYTTPQAKLDAAGRAQNLLGAFAGNVQASGLSCLLIDDVTTTHSTLTACAETLKNAGANRVYAACVCRTMYRGSKTACESTNS